MWRYVCGTLAIFPYVACSTQKLTKLAHMGHGTPLLGARAFTLKLLSGKSI